MIKPVLGNDFRALAKNRESVAMLANKQALAESLQCWVVATLNSHKNGAQACIPKYRERLAVDIGRTRLEVPVKVKIPAQ